LTAICTIITSNYLPWALALNKSLAQFNPEINMFIVVSDSENVESTHLKDFPNSRILYLKDLQDVEIGKKICDKYADQPHVLRWALKPVILLKLLSKFEKVLYCDGDLFFFNDYNFLWKELDRYNILLSPHYRSHLPGIDFPQFEVVFTHGFYNAGFVGVNKNAVPAVTWWTEMCLFSCEKDYTKGHYFDQKYLDAMPIYFDNVGMIRHLGCNVSEWNLGFSKREVQDDGSILINGIYPVIFVHFANKTIMKMVTGEDKLGVAYAQKFSDTLQYFGWKKCVVQDAREKLSRKKAPKKSLSSRIVSKFKKLLP
jgi:hypothetical protein